MILKHSHELSNHKIVQWNIEGHIKTIGKNCILVVSEYLKNKLSVGYETITWGEFAGNGPLYGSLDARKQVARLNELLELREIPSETILQIVPFCMEDEGELYFNELKKLKWETVTYIRNPVDFLDLKHVS